MSPVKLGGSVSEISLRHFFLRTNFDVFRYMRSRAGPVTAFSVFATEISVTGIRISDLNTPVTGTEFF